MEIGKKSKTVGIYAIFNGVNSKAYVGSSCAIGRRFIDHKSKLRNNKHPNPHLQSAYNKYGESEFFFFKIEECDQSRLEEREKFWINSLDSINSGYNIRLECGSNAGIKFNPESCKRGAEGRRKFYAENPEYRKRLSDIAIERNYAKRLQDSNGGVGFWAGKKRSEEDKLKMSLAKKGRKLSPEGRAILDAARKKRWDNYRKNVCISNNL